jgi:hypothetical protein
MEKGVGTSKMKSEESILLTWILGGDVMPENVLAYIASKKLYEHT